MIKVLHGISTNYCNVVTEARIAKEIGYEALEILPDKLLRYLNNGGTTDAYKKLLDQYGIKAGCINALLGIGRHEKGEKEEMLTEAERLCQIAQELDCPVIQILALHELDHLPEEKVLDIMTENIREIAELGITYGGIKFQIELIAYTVFNSIGQALEVIRRVNKDNVGLVIDFWHLHAAGIDSPETVAALDKELIYGVHFCDGRKPVAEEEWKEQVLRNYMPGEGELDIPAWVAAVKATGYKGMWSSELVSPNRWEHDLWQNAKECLDNMTEYIG